MKHLISTVIAMLLLGTMVASGGTRVQSAERPFHSVRELISASGTQIAEHEDEIHATIATTMKQLSAQAHPAELIVIDGKLKVILASHADCFGPEAYLDRPSVFATLNGVDVIPVNGDFETWRRLNMMLNEHGATYVARTRDELTDMMSMLEGINLAIRNHELGYGAWPDFSKQWEALPDLGFSLDELPRNPLAHPDVNVKIVIVDEPGLTGSHVSLNEAAWVWNSADKKMYTAGWSEQQLRKALDVFKRPPEYSDWRRRLAVKTALGGMRAALGNFKNTSRQTGENRYPTLEEINGGSVIRGAPDQLINPLRNSAVFQLSQWNPDEPPVSGTAGWNYDPVVGKVWANSNFINEHRF